MYKIEEIKKGDSKMSLALQSKPFGPSFTEEQVEEADSMEVWGTSIGDKGDDFVEFRLQQGGKTIHSKRIGGY